MLDDYLALLRAARAVRLAELDTAFDRALKDDDPERLAAIRGERRSLLALPASIQAGDRAALVAQWPASFPPLPAWFTEPGSVGPAGDPHVVDCAPAVEEKGTPLPADPSPPDLETVRGWRVGFANRAYDEAIEALDREAAALRPPSKPSDLVPLRDQARQHRDERLARIAAATTVADLADL